jgi:hypothetical protein
MAHFAHIKDGIVDQVIVIDQETLNTGNWGNPSEWIQTSYNTHGGQHPEGRPLRKNFAGIGYSYDAGRDAFIPPKPFASWLLNEDTCLWGSPVAMPVEEGKVFTWDEETTSWVEVVAPEAPAGE